METEQLRTVLSITSRRILLTKEAQARASLRQVLFGLRQLLDKKADLSLKITDESVSLDPAHVEIENRKSGEELLSGFHLADAAFEEWLRDERLRTEAPDKAGSEPGNDAASAKPGIVVLPFSNMSGDPEQEYLSGNR